MEITVVTDSSFQVQDGGQNSAIPYKLSDTELLPIPDSRNDTQANTTRSESICEANDKTEPFDILIDINSNCHVIDRNRSSNKQPMRTKKRARNGNPVSSRGANKSNSLVKTTNTATKRRQPAYCYPYYCQQYYHPLACLNRWMIIPSNWDIGIPYMCCCNYHHNCNYNYNYEYAYYNYHPN